MGSGGRSQENEERFLSWQKGGFDPSQLPSCVLEGDNVDYWMSRAIEADSIRGVRALLFNLGRYNCLELVCKTANEKWVQQLIKDRGNDPEVLDLFTLLAECGFCRQELMDHLVDKIPEGPYTQAFARILGDSVPSDLIDRVTRGLVDAGYSEIVEDEQSLRRWTISQGYLRLLSDDELTALCDEHLGFRCTRDLLARWISPDAPIEYFPLPRQPPRFHTPHSLWQWHYEQLALEAPQDCDAWLEMKGRSKDLFNWWAAINSGITQNPSTITTEALSKSARRLDIVECGDPQFYVYFKQQRFDPRELLLQLKAEAAALDPIYGQSAEAAGVALRSDVAALAMLTQLRPLEVLDSKETVRFLYVHGADESKLDIHTALQYNDRKIYDVVTFDKSARFDLVARLLSSIFPPSCSLRSATLDAGRLGLQAALAHQCRVI